MQRDPASLNVRLEERINGGYRHPRFESDTRHPAVAGIEVSAPAGIARKRPIVIAQRITQVVVARSAPETLDVIVLVQGRNALRRELATDPVGLFDEVNAFFTARGCERRSNSSRSTAHNEHIACYVVLGMEVADRNDSDTGIAVDGHPHDIDQRVTSAFHGSHDVMFAAAVPK